jgi:S1-C subfamily serine protease
VQNVAPSIAHIYSGDGADAAFLALGEVVDKNGKIATDASALGTATDVVVVLSDGSKVRSALAQKDELTGIAFMKSATTTIDGKPVAWKSAGLADKPTLGQTGVVIVGKTIQRIESGIITALIPLDKGGPVLDTSIAGDEIMPGSPLLDTDGDILGVSTGLSRASSPSGFIQVVSQIPAPAPANTDKSADKSTAK